MQGHGRLDPTLSVLGCFLYLNARIFTFQEYIFLKMSYILQHIDAFVISFYFKLWSTYDLDVNVFKRLCLPYRTVPGWDIVSLCIACWPVLT